MNKNELIKAGFQAGYLEKQADILEDLAGWWKELDPRWQHAIMGGAMGAIPSMMYGGFTGQTMQDMLLNTLLFGGLGAGAGYMMPLTDPKTILARMAGDPEKAKEYLEKDPAGKLMLQTVGQLPATQRMAMSYAPMLSHFTDVSKYAPKEFRRVFKHWQKPEAWEQKGGFSPYKSLLIGMAGDPEKAKKFLEKTMYGPLMLRKIKEEAQEKLTPKMIRAISTKRPIATGKDIEEVPLDVTTFIPEKYRGLLKAWQRPATWETQEGFSPYVKAMAKHEIRKELDPYIKTLDPYTKKMQEMYKHLKGRPLLSTGIGMAGTPIPPVSIAGKKLSTTELIKKTDMPDINLQQLYREHITPSIRPFTKKYTIPAVEKAKRGYELYKKTPSSIIKAYKGISDLRRKWIK